MPLQQHHVNRLKQIVEAEQGEVLSDKEAWLMARRLYGMFRLLLHGVLDEDIE